MPSTITAEKAALRARLAALPFPDCSALTERFLSLPEVGSAQTLLLFFSTQREPDTAHAIETLLRAGKTVCLPRCLPGRSMEARAWTGREELVPSAYGIPEPGHGCPVVARDRIDVILVPNLCCDRENYRLGHGGGYYDRYLAGYRGFTVSICPEEFMQPAVPRDEFDLPVGLVLCG
ncbi:MAG: 5-formyltetrahydrofolate cyclo-ligase [Clostridia bacterium]|nr:5-formyltetrahydrofolate cyclo-ligase [Clostridia bacterium]